MLRIRHFQVDDVGVEGAFAVDELEVEDVRLGRAEDVGDGGQRAVLRDGQKVRFAVSHQEKGAQAENVETLD